MLARLLPEVSAFARASAASAEDAAAFEDRARELSVYTARVLTVLLTCGILAFWPLDLLLFRGDAATVERLATWRLAVAITLAGAFFVLGHVRAARAHHVLTITAFGVVGAVLTGALTVTIDAPARPFLFGQYLMPLCSVAMIAPLRRRVATVSVLTAALLVTCVLADPSLVSAPVFGVFLCMFAASAVLATIGGHVVYHLVRANFLQARALAQRASELHQLDRMKSELFADISHELRTPLTLILGSLRTLRGGGLRGAAADAVIASGLRSTSRLVLLVNEILELARIDRGMRPVDTAPIDLAALVRGVVADFESGAAGARSVEVVGAGAPVPICASRQQMKKVLYNLLSNALKFTDPARRRVRITLSSTGGEVSLAVSDNGAGIPADQLDRVFDRFVRLAPASARSREGTGIGLALVKGIVSQAGGRVEVESKLGEGSTFRIALPRGDVSGFQAGGDAADDDDDLADLVRYAAPARKEESMNGEAAPPASDRLDRPSVLLVEDNDDLRRYTRRILRVRFRVRDARDGAEGLELARSQPPDLIVTDVMMPRMTGPELLRAVRGDEALRETPVIFLTARAGADARSESLEGGADDYICKPFEERELLARVENLVARRRQARELAALNRELEARIEARTAELHALASHLSEVLEQERARIARDIHDELGQTLSAMRLEVEQAARDAATEDARDAMGRITHLLSETIGTSRRILSELRPRVLDDFGLIAAVEWLVEQFRARYGVACELAIDPDLDADPARSTALFRIVQECLNNVAKHAAAGRVEIALALDAGDIRLIVRDDGRGMPPPGRGSGGMGLLGIRERAWQFGGHAEIAGAPGQGTTVDVRIPAGEAGAREEAAA